MGDMTHTVVYGDGSCPRRADAATLIVTLLRFLDEAVERA
jgi:hypothetical protein